MATFTARLLRVEPESNPEEALVPLEAEGIVEANERANDLITGNLRGLGWRSYGDPDLWGKPQRRVLEVFAVDAKGKRL